MSAWAPLTSSSSSSPARGDRAFAFFFLNGYFYYKRQPLRFNCLNKQAIISWNALWKVIKDSLRATLGKTSCLEERNRRKLIVFPVKGGQMLAGVHVYDVWRVYGGLYILYVYSGREKWIKRQQMEQDRFNWRSREYSNQGKDRFNRKRSWNVLREHIKHTRRPHLSIINICIV